MNKNTYILILSCQDTSGIVATVTGFLAQHDGFIHESAQFGDESTNQFFMRVEFSRNDQVHDKETLSQAFEMEVASKFGMNWQLYNKSAKSRVVIMVSKYGHCLNDLLHRYRTKSLAIEIPAIISNHPDFREMAEWYQIPFYHLPIIGSDKKSQEAEVSEVIKRHTIDVVVLARYMQVLSPELCKKLTGKAINIHHSFLPSFKGAKPYTQAFDRGVKLIGATAHYVTSDLDEGPIIDQEVARVDHSYKSEDLESAGRDIECAVLARALKYHTEHRVLMNGRKTVVFK